MIELSIPLDTPHDMTPENEVKLDRAARVAAWVLGYRSVRHFELAAKQALIAAVEIPEKKTKRQKVGA